MNFAGLSVCNCRMQCNRKQKKKKQRQQWHELKSKAAINEVHNIKVIHFIVFVCTPLKLH